MLSPVTDARILRRHRAMQRRTTRTAAKPKGAIPARNKTAKERASDALWDWALSEVTNPSLIASDHLLQTYGFSARVSTCFPLHVDSTFAAESSSDLAPLETSEPRSSSESPSRDLPRQPESSDVNVDGTPPGPSSTCTKNQCRSNPNCLNHLGQEKLRSEGGICITALDARLADALYKNLLGSSS